ncbi:MAG TPA: hypothetical protein PLP42_07470 [Acidobacteriota bacterium]|nr:hypothetical protein [Acidobacteriota bacterium]
MTDPVLLNEGIARLVDLYTERVLKRPHREVTLRGRKCRARIMQTLLGLEVKAGRKRITCPDLATARYLRVFAEIGLPSVRIPYDPTVTRSLVSEVESSLEAIKTTGPPEGRRQCRVFGKLRTELQRAEQEQGEGLTISRKSP